MLAQVHVLWPFAWAGLQWLKLKLITRFLASPGFGNSAEGRPGLWLLGIHPQPAVANCSEQCPQAAPAECKSRSTWTPRPIARAWPHCSLCCGWIMRKLDTKGSFLGGPHGSWWAHARHVARPSLPFHPPHSPGPGRIKARSTAFVASVIGQGVGPAGGCRQQAGATGSGSLCKLWCWWLPDYNPGPQSKPNHFPQALHSRTG